MALYEVQSDGTLKKVAGIGANNAIIDQNTNALNKFWTGTLAEYNALGTHDANTFYNITDDNAGNVIQLKTLWSGSKTTSGDVTLSEDYTQYPLIILTGMNSGNELASFVIPSSTIKWNTDSSHPYDMGNNTKDANRYCNIYHKNNTTLTILSIGNFTFLYVEGVK